MKCLVLIVSVIAVVFTVNCRDVPDQPEGGDKEQQLVETALTAHDVPGQPDGRRTDNAHQLEETYRAALEEHQKEMAEDIIHRSKRKIEMVIDPSEIEVNIKKDTQDTQTNNLDTILANFTDQVDISISNLKDDIDIKMLNMTDTLEWIVQQFKGLRCSTANGFMSPTEDQCFIYFKDVKITLDAANTYCITRGLQLAEPENHNALWLRKHVIDAYGSDDWAWLGGRGNGSNMIWPIKQEIISSSNSLWWPGHPASYLTTNHCVLLSIHAPHLNSNPNDVYLAYSTGGNRPFICELV